MKGNIRVGTAGWSIPAEQKDMFAGGKTHLERYAAIFDAVEINSSFYRAHKASTYLRWADAVPDDFLFSVKIPKAITHERRLVDCENTFEEFLSGIRHLGNKLGTLLVQLPPTLRYDERIAVAFFTFVRSGVDHALAVEPRHASWFGTDVADMLRDLRVTRVAADPPKVATATVPGGWSANAYYRLHGSPRVYYSDYSDEALQGLRVALKEKAETCEQVWCIFDNTADAKALKNALTLVGLLKL